MNNYIIEGFNDIHFEELSGYDNVMEIIKKLMRSYGYKQILTPSFESYDMYSIDGALPREKMFKLIDNTGKVLVLRPDVTIPITRMAATGYKDQDEILKLAYITTIFRDFSSNTNFRKEFMQAGVEYFGNNMPDCDAEIIALAINILLDLGFKSIHIDIGQVAFLNAIFNETSIKNNEKEKILNYIEHKNICDLRLYLSSLDITNEINSIICSIPMLFGKYDETILKAKKLCINDTMKDAIKNIEETYEVLKNYGFEDYIYVDLGFTNQLNYYSGLIFKGYVNDIGEVILSGGRYDKLSKTFGVDRPASGFGINISSIIDIINKSLSFENYFDLLLLYNEKELSTATDICTKLRSSGFSVNCISNSNQNNINKSNYKSVASLNNNNLIRMVDNKEIQVTVTELIQFLKGAK